MPHGLFQWIVAWVGLGVCVVLAMNTGRLIDRLRNKRRSYEEIEYRLAVAYQVVGGLLDELGTFDTPRGQELLNYFAGFPDAKDPLPFDAKAFRHPPTTLH